jgi:hypothetical protein
MTRKWIKDFIWGFAGGIPIVIILNISGLLEKPLSILLPWAIGIGIVLGLLSGLIIRLYRRRSMKHQTTP